MNAYKQMAERIKEIAVFCLKNRGKCFGDDFNGALAFRYVAHHFVVGTVFVCRDEQDRIQMVVFAWRNNASEILRKEMESKPQFDWSVPASSGDSVLIAQVIGKREFLGTLLRKITAAWPESPGLRLFMYRRRNEAPKLCELDWKTLNRFAYGHAEHS